MVTGGSCGARPPSCSVVRVAPARRCGFAGAGPAAVALIAPPFPLRGGRPPGPGGAEGRACGSPAVVGAGGGGGGGGGGAASPPALRSVRGGGWVEGGPLAPWRCLSSAGGEGRGRHGGPGPGGQPSARGLSLHPPPLSRAGCSRRPSPGPFIPRPLSRGAGRPGVAVRVSGQWLAGCGAAGSSPRSLSPHSLLREVARPRTSCHTVGGAWVRGPIPPPQPSRIRRLGLHLRRRLCGGWGCGGGGLCRR